MNNSTSQKALILGGTSGIGLAPAQHIVSQALARTDPGCINRGVWFRSTAEIPKS